MIESKDEYSTSEGKVGLSLMNDRLQSIINTAPLIQKLVPLDCMIGISDREKFLHYLPGRAISIGRDIRGERLSSDDGLYHAVHSGKEHIVKLPREVFGFPFRSVAVPIHDEKGYVIGAIALGVSLQTQESLLSIAQMIVTSSQEISAATKELAQSAEELSLQQELLSRLSNEVLEQVKKTDQILKFINDVAMKSNLLGLNASIEASRAGEQGKGFAVVAEEIRKMAVNSAQSVKEIREILNIIKERVTIMNSKITQTTDIGHQQVAATEEIHASVQEFADSAQKIEDVAKIV
ncbi:methyl-accepting chemotaxis protein [Heliorestis convoluta]|uniref:methyl-accepting chemotaxis protein n=1 Tax=Heliorestis convoluta TaxID=356322 RepID=UPI001A9B6C6A|nr:methyl-accepting chemotaxis protein [Heliorestis convoluta]